MKTSIQHRILGLAAATLLVVGPLSAQEAADTHKAGATNLREGWFVSAGVGAQIYFGDHDRQCKAGDRLAPALDIVVGKWITPGIGVRLMYSGLSARGATQKGSLVHSTGKDVPGKGGSGYWLEKQKFSVANFHADALFDLLGLIRPQEAEQAWSCGPYAGLGYARVLEKESAGSLSVNLGLFGSYRINDAISATLDTRAALLNDHFDGEPGGRKYEGLWSVSLGITYRFR